MCNCEIEHLSHKYASFGNIFLLCRVGQVCRCYVCYNVFFDHVFAALTFAGTTGSRFQRLLKLMLLFRIDGLFRECVVLRLFCLWRRGLTRRSDNVRRLTFGRPPFFRYRKTTLLERPCFGSKYHWTPKIWVLEIPVWCDFFPH